VYSASCANQLHPASAAMVGAASPPAAIRPKIVAEAPVPVALVVCQSTVQPAGVVGGVALARPTTLQISVLPTVRFSPVPHAGVTAVPPAAVLTAPIVPTSDQAMLSPRCDAPRAPP
jgi:hypothetical protein